MDVTFFRGWLGADAETINAPGGVVGARFRLGVNDSYLGAQGEWVKRETVWISCEAWRKVAETALPVLTKGWAVIVVGKWRATSWTAEDGSKRSKNVFHIESVGVDVGAMEVKGVAKRLASGKSQQGGAPVVPPPPAAPPSFEPAVAAPVAESAPNPFLVGEGQ